VKLENFIVVYGQFIQDTAYNKSVKYWRSYDEKISVWFLCPTVYTTPTTFDTQKRFFSFKFF